MISRLIELVFDKAGFCPYTGHGRISVTPSNSNRDTIAFCHQGSQSLFNLFQRSIKERSRSPCKRRENHANLWQKQNTDRNRLRIYSILPFFYVNSLCALHCCEATVARGCLDPRAKTSSRHVESSDATQYD